MRDICCGICGYRFKTEQKLETRSYDYEEYQELVSYPDPTDSNPAHLVRNYICDRCYQDIGNVIRNKIIEGYESYIENLPNRIEAEHKRFEGVVEALENEQRKVESVCQKLKDVDYLFELSDEDLEQIDVLNSVFYTSGTFYLKDAIRIERERVKDERPFYDWLKLFDIDDSVNGGIYHHNVMDVEAFKNILQKTRVQNYSYEEMCKLLEKIDEYINKYK